MRTTKLSPRGSFLLPLAAVFLIVATPVSGQGGGAGDGVRLGIAFGGIATVGFTVEYFDDHQSVEVTVGTWSFKDVSASVLLKHYFGAGDLLPFVGGGLWLVAAKPESERTGFAAVLQAPLGVDWRTAGRHHVGLHLNVNRALAVRRTDPDDDLPLNNRLVPLPGVYYRWRR